MSVKSNFPIFSVLTRTLKISIKFVRLSSVNKNLNRSNPFNILGLMNIRNFFQLIWYSSMVYKMYLTFTAYKNTLDLLFSVSS